MNPIGEPDAGNRHVRFDERGWETGDWQSLKHRAHPRLYPRGAFSHQFRTNARDRSDQLIGVIPLTMQRVRG
jgi:hypothetical protein